MKPIIIALILFVAGPHLVPIIFGDLLPTVLGTVSTLGD
jgi:hypothetical protein